MIPVGTTLFPYAAETSFPSDHTTFMLSIALMMSYFKETRKIGIILAVLGLIGGLSRVFCRSTFPIRHYRIVRSFNYSFTDNLLFQGLKCLFKPPFN